MDPIPLPPLPPRSEETHKGECGRVLVIAGSAGMMGAGALASLAALRGGAGLVSWAVPRSLNATAEPMALEVITHPIPETAGLSPSVAAREYLDEAARETSATLLGPGLPVAGETGELIRLLIPEIPAPLVLDAGALTALGKDATLLMKRKAPTIVTPHPGEMARLMNRNAAQIQEEREATASLYAKKTGVVVILKGHGTVVTDGARLAVNETGNGGMATAGAGDVLAGLVAGLLAQRMEPLDAARLAVYLHGLAGDLAVEKTGPHSLVAGDLLAWLPNAFLHHGSRERGGR